MEEALRRLSHATRVGQLTISQEGPIPIERQPSHDERMRLMMEMRLKRSLGMSVAATDLQHGFYLAARSASDERLHCCVDANVVLFCLTYIQKVS